jgi:hypothetical protein
VRVARSAMIEAEAQLRKGLDLLARLPDRTERRRHELDLKIALAASPIATRGYMAPEVAEIYARVRTLCDEPDEPSQLGWVLAGQWSYHLVRHEFTLALRHAKELLALSQTRNDAFIKQAACYANSRTYYLLGDFSASRVHAECDAGGHAHGPRSASDASSGDYRHHKSHHQPN